MTNKVEIDLRLPFEETIKRALALFASAHRRSEKEMVGALRRLYELAHGRSVQTTLGLIPIAPAVAPGLSDGTFFLTIHSELLTATASQSAVTFGDTSAIPHQDLPPNPNAISNQS
jgi:hypothetical protein